MPGLVDLAVRLREPGHEHEGMLASEMAAAVAGGVTSVVCPPDTEPVLDESGLVEMLRHRAEQLKKARLFPLGALTRNLEGEVLTEMLHLTQAGCIGFSQAEVPWPIPRSCSAPCNTPARLGIRSGCARRSCIWARAWRPVAPGYAHGPLGCSGGGRDHCPAHHF
jgi:dihydroorotase-like cyclic amidohydrolase